jgi:16S rRNA (uracil1498-N3)-methyltransferase
MPADLTEGASVTLTTAQTHRLRNVLRLGPGATIAAFNAQQGEWSCTISELGRNAGVLVVERRLRAPEPQPDFWLLFAPVKRARLDWLVEKATEFGVAALLPVWTARTQSERINLERLTALATAAAEQCERLSVPEIRAPERLDRVLAEWPTARTLLVCDESGGGRPIADAIADLALPASAAILIGPEGGFDARELDAFGKLPIVNRVGLGPRVLRAETAAVAAMAVFQALAGDWRRARPR